MLGRLKMGIDECIYTYKSLIGIIFDVGAWEEWAKDFPGALDCLWTFAKKIATEVKKTYHWTARGSVYSNEAFEDVIKNLVKKKLGSEDVSLLEGNPACKVYCFLIPLSVYIKLIILYLF